MNISPWIYFGWQHGRQLADLVGNAKKPDGKFLELAHAVAPWLKKWFPWVNDNHLLDDALDAFENSMVNQPTITHWPGYPDPTQQ